MHFSAFHPDWKMLDTPPTPPATLTRARQIALANGVRYAYTGNVHDPEGDATCCHGCGAALIERDWYELIGYGLERRRPLPRLRHALRRGVRGPAGSWGRRRRPVRLAEPVRV